MPTPFLFINGERLNRDFIIICSELSDGAPFKPKLLWQQLYTPVAGGSEADGWH
nr:hypothetical protein Iba_chr01aCG1480 [Ipomoea batatas]